jgi:putative addiction module component (TIGR02574 family)
MKLTDFPALIKLPKRQRLKLAEELWFSSVDDSLPVSPTQRNLLDERWRQYRKGSVKRLSLDDLERRLQRK